jgi:colanic acid/amylovoran biosynthesis glycosyltransferase
LKVAYVTIQFPVPSETFATNEVRTLRGLGVSVSVHGLRPARPDVARLLRDRGIIGLVVTHNGALPTLHGLFAALRHPVLLLRVLTWIGRVNRERPRELLMSLALLPRAFDILRRIEAERPDVVHMYWGHYPALVGYLVQHRLPDTVTSMSIVAYDLNREYPGAVDVARGADVVRTHARANVAHVVRFTGVPADRVHVIYNGVDLAWVEGIARAASRIPRRIVATGRLIPAKGMDDVLTAFSAIHERWDDATLVVIGDGPERESLRSKSETLGVAGAVQFLGHVPHARVVEEMAKAEAFMLLSRYESERLPNVVKEAMAAGCLCITTPTPGIEELVEAGVSGYVVPMSDPGAASDVVQALFSGQIDASSITSRGAARVRADFDLASTVPRYVALWSAAVGTKRAASPPIGGRGA